MTLGIDTRMTLLAAGLIFLLALVLGMWKRFEHPDRAMGIGMGLLIVGEIGGFGVILAGFVVGQLL